MKHTPTPWQSNHDDILASDDPCDVVAVVVERDDFDETLANAEFIVRAVNSHDKLVKALEECKHWHQGDKWRGSDDADQKGAWNRHMAIIDEALAAAKGE